MLVSGSKKAHNETQALLHRHPDIVLPFLADCIGECEITDVRMEYPVIGSDGMYRCCPDLLFFVATSNRRYVVPGEVKSNPRRRKTRQSAGRQLRTFYTGITKGLDPDITARDVHYGLIINGSPERFRITPYNLRVGASRRVNPKYRRLQLVA